jgi:uncharacterized protein (DUF885 family)
MTTQSAASGSDDSLNRALSILDEAWEEMRRSPFVQSQLGINPARLPDVSRAAVQRRSTVGCSLLKRLATVYESELTHDLALTLRLVRFHANNWSREADWYWIAIDPLGVGFFGLFLPTAYCGGFLFSTVHGQLASFTFTEPGDLDRYLALVADYARLVDQFTERTAGQAERGILMPKVQVRQARTLLAAYKSGARKTLGVDPERLLRFPVHDFSSELESRIAERVEPAFERALQGLSDDYLERAPEAVGLGQYPGGADVYATLVKLHTTLDLTPEEVHARGHERIAQIETSMQAIRKDLGFDGDRAAFEAHLNEDPRWRASSVESIAAFFQRYIERLEPRLKEYFSIAPRSTYGVAPLPEALQGSMTYGYYEAPRAGSAQGRYLFNAGNLLKQALFILGALTYHELMPGHHLHFATQHENESLHGLRKHGFVTAFNEGWAEYAAALAGEMGLYEEPEERYGRLVMDAFLTTRLVVDTGMNVLGWSLERAQDYMRAHSGMTETEILTESVRYSCDIPGQALAYKLGDTFILALRDRSRQALGTRFSIKDFHTAVLGCGALPMSELDWHVVHEIERIRQSRQEQ